MDANSSAITASVQDVELWTAEDVQSWAETCVRRNDADAALFARKGLDGRALLTIRPGSPLIWICPLMAKARLLKLFEIVLLVCSA